MQVTFYQRKRRPNANFSMEFIFEDVRQRLQGQLDARVCIAPFHSNGVVRRLLIALDAWWRQGQITHVTGDINFAAILLRRHSTVLTVLDCGFLERTLGWRHALLKWFWLALPVARATVITTISDAARQDILRYTHCDPARVSVIPVAVSSRFVPVPRAFNTDCPRILQIGTAPNKNLPRLIQALSGVNCVLVIVGELDDGLREQIQQAGLRMENHVNLTQNEIVQQYVQADLVAFASTYEGFGMPIVEAQMTGRPVVTSNLSSMPEVAGRGACLVDPCSVESIRQGILRVIQNSYYRDELIAFGFQNARRFDGQVIALQYLQVYQRLAAAAP